MNFFRRRAKYISEIPSRLAFSPWYIVRKIMYPYVNLRINVRGDLGEKYYVSEEDIDDKTLRGVLDKYYDLYFPKKTDSSKVKKIWDIGAHHGYYTVRCLYEYPSCEVISIEPNNKSVERIISVVESNSANGRVKIINAALSEKEGKLSLQLSDRGSWGDSLYLSGDESVSEEEVDTTTTEKLLEYGNPDIIKCNAEGAEYILVRELSQREIYPEIFVLMVHPEFGDPESLLQNKYFNNYEMDDRFSTEKRLRYLFIKK